MFNFTDLLYTWCVKYKRAFRVVTFKSLRIEEVFFLKNVFWTLRSGWRHSAWRRVRLVNCLVNWQKSADSRGGCAPVGVVTADFKAFHCLKMQNASSALESQHDRMLIGVEWAPPATFDCLCSILVKFGYFGWNSHNLRPLKKKIFFYFYHFKTTFWWH